MKGILLILAALSVSSTLLAMPDIQQNDFSMPKTGWNVLHSKDHTGEQKLITIKNTPQEQTYLYWMGPGATTAIQAHATYEEVIIVQGSLMG